MTPNEAADILGVSAGATRAEIEHAFRVRARQQHPDSAANPDPAAFDRLITARTVLEGAEIVIIARISGWILAAWIAIFVVGAALSFVVGPVPGSPFDLLLRVIPMGVLSVAFAVTGKPWLQLAVQLFAGASALITLGYANFGSLLSLGVLLVPVIGLFIEGRSRARMLGLR